MTKPKNKLDFKSWNEFKLCPYFRYKEGYNELFIYLTGNGKLCAEFISPSGTIRNEYLFDEYGYRSSVSDIMRGFETIKANRKKEEKK